MSLNHLSTFSGVGGLELGMERAGITTVGQVELDPYCRAVLASHWPEVPRHDDVRTAPAWWLGEQRPRVDVVSGGFPCQPFSSLGLGRGIGDERWGWPWMADVVRAVRPRYVVVENVPRLLRDADAFGWVLGDLHELGFDAEWSIVPACAVGAPHSRERLFLVAYPQGVDGEQPLHLQAAVEAGRAGTGAAGGAGEPAGLVPPARAVQTHRVAVEACVRPAFVLDDQAADELSYLWDYGVSEGVETGGNQLLGNPISHATNTWLR